MQYNLPSGKEVEFVLGDITKITADAIVNAANNTLLGGEGVDDAIHAAAGPDLYAECLKIGYCETGQAVITKGYRLPVKNIIHTVGPMWFETATPENKDALLASAYRSSLALAEENSLPHIAFPSISTGAFLFPVERAAPIAIKTVLEFLQSSVAVKKVTFVLHSKPDFDCYTQYYDILTLSSK